MNAFGVDGMSDVSDEVREGVDGGFVSAVDIVEGWYVAREGRG